MPITDAHQLDINTIDTLEAMEYAPVYHQWILDEFSQHIGKNIVEVGSGTGSISKKLLEYKPDNLFCIEPSEAVFTLLQNKLTTELDSKNYTTKVKSYCSFLGDASQELKQKSIDTIIYINVLEHVEHDIDELKIMHETLSPNGKILIFVPALQWIYGTHDKNCGHFRRYYKKELKEKVEAAGFEIVSNKYFDFMGILPWWFTFRVLKLKYLNNSQSKIYDNIVVPITRKLEQIIIPAAGKNLILIARKKSN